MQLEWTNYGQFKGPSLEVSEIIMLQICILFHFI